MKVSEPIFKNRAPDETIDCEICVKIGEFTPYIRFGGGPDDSFGWVINELHKENLITIPKEFTNTAEDVPLNDNPFLDSYFNPHKYCLDAVMPYYKGLNSLTETKFVVLQTIPLTVAQLNRVYSYHDAEYEYAHGVHSNCNTIFLDAMTPVMTTYQKYEMIFKVVRSHEQNIRLAAKK